MCSLTLTESNHHQGSWASFWSFAFNLLFFLCSSTQANVARILDPSVDLWIRDGNDASSFGYWVQRQSIASSGRRLTRIMRVYENSATRFQALRKYKPGTKVCGGPFIYGDAGLRADLHRVSRTLLNSTF
ncbi:hypothetical protein LZ30DRAFT_362857 [Colletotrichum cereale]|nr:hypothetical protein LZ30DRAFT_362857 [Colletotrichum cereale]